ncbi:MAG: ATP-binding protein [Alphaproteobacteria bacterium]|nr:ATP-binding protein [Alphaproteobacteria bacterium]
MIAEISYLGAIRKAVVDLQKPLTLFCGPNSTGKTYLSYLLYAIFENTDYVESKGLDKIVKHFSEYKEFTLNRELVENFIQDVAASMKAKLGSIFGIGDTAVDKLFSQFELSLILSDGDYEKMLESPCRLISKNGEKEFGIVKDASSDKVIYHMNGENSTIGRESLMGLRLMINHFFRLLCFRNSGGVRMLTVERNSIYTFKTELSLGRNELIDRIQQKSGRSELDILDMVNSSSRRYPLAVRSSLRIANDLENVQKFNSPYYKIAELIEKGILQGEVKITRTGDVEFVSDKVGKTKHLPIHLTSSIVKTMSSLVIYLKHIARKGDLLIIDEPEMNFHPNVQISLMQIFAILTKLDLRIIISTHSDYMIREVNNLIMAGTIYSKDAQLIRELGYNEKMLLNKNDIAVKYFNYGKLKRLLDVVDVKVEDDGFAIESIDNTINDQNRITETLFDHLQEE